MWRCVCLFMCLRVSVGVVVMFLSHIHAAFTGLANQGATCYLNSAIQALFMTPEFRNAMYRFVVVVVVVVVIIIIIIVVVVVVVAAFVIFNAAAVVVALFVLVLVLVLLFSCRRKCCCCCSSCCSVFVCVDSTGIVARMMGTTVNAFPFSSRSFSCCCRCVCVCVYGWTCVCTWVCGVCGCVWCF